VVLTYRGAVRENARLTAANALLAAQDNALRGEVARMLEYQEAASKRSIQQRKRIAKLESLRSVRNEKGDIDPVNDNILVFLNGMFSATDNNQAANSSDNAALLGGGPAPSSF